LHACRSTLEDPRLQTNFDKNVRAKLGVGKEEFVNVDALDPSFFSVDMFSAEELLNDGSSFVFYRGFDYKGKVLTERPKFFDFFTRTDANGVPIRQIDAFRPFYAAGYISDRFYFKDLTFNVGLRVDRYDANQYVLKDEYSLYEIKGYRARIRNHGHSCFLCEIVIRSQFHTTYEPEA
jgi:hypothetical protein